MSKSASWPRGSPTSFLESREDLGSPTTRSCRHIRRPIRASTAPQVRQSTVLPWRHLVPLAAMDSSVELGGAVHPASWRHGCPLTHSPLAQLSTMIERPTTPVARLTTLFAAIVKGTRSITRSPSLQCTSPPKPSTLRSRAAVGGIGIIPKIADFEILKPISRGAFGYAVCRI